MLKIKLIAATISLALGSSLVLADHHGGSRYAMDGVKSVVVNNYGECWRSKGGIKQLLEECGDVIPMEEPEPEPEPVDGDDDGDGVLNSVDRCPDTRPGATVDFVGCEIVENITINLVEDEFDFDSAELKPNMKAALEEFAQKVKDSVGVEQITIIGHTDSIGSEEYNMKLSLRRAQAAADYLRELGLDNIVVEGRGESEPIADNSTREGRAKNRRIEITTH